MSSSEKRKTHSENSLEEQGRNDSTTTVRREAKRARSNNARHAAFHHCHLTMLKSLYKESPAEDGHVESSTWQMVELFLERRPLLMKQQTERAELSNVHREAVQLSERSSTELDSHSIKSFSAAGKVGQQSPHRHHASSMFSPRSPYESTASRRPPHTSSSLALVARLLGRKAAAANVKLQDFTQPFGVLVAATDERLEKLEQMLERLRQEKLERAQSRMTRLLSPLMNDTANQHRASSQDETEKDSTIAKVEFKMRLWKMLAHALQDVS